jgi:hypothetical protein
MPKLARVKAAARDVVQRTDSDLMGVCTLIIHLADAVIVLEKVAGNARVKAYCTSASTFIFTAP